MVSEESNINSNIARAIERQVDERENDGRSNDPWNDCCKEKATRGKYIVERAVNEEWIFIVDQE